MFQLHHDLSLQLMRTRNEKAFVDGTEGKSICPIVLHAQCFQSKQATLFGDVHAH